MLSVDELNQAEMDIITLSLFNYVTQGISGDIGFDYAMSDETELNFDN
jgi:outer membrane protein W